MKKIIHQKNQTVNHQQKNCKQNQVKNFALFVQPVSLMTHLLVIICCIPQKCNKYSVALTVHKIQSLGTQKSSTCLSYLQIKNLKNTFNCKMISKLPPL